MAAKKEAGCSAAEAVELRIVEMAFLLSRGDVCGTVKWLESLGCKEVYLGSGDATVTGLTGVRVGLVKADPISCAVQLAFALAGVYWPSVYPGLLKRADAEWKLQSHASVNSPGRSKAPGRSKIRERNHAPMLPGLL